MKFIIISISTYFEIDLKPWRRKSLTRNNHIGLPLCHICLVLIKANHIFYMLLEAKQVELVGII